MANHNGHHRGMDVEHGYQDPRDQRARERGRDDFRGFEGDASGGGYGYDDGNPRVTMNDRGQSGTQSGGRLGATNTNYTNQQGGNRGYWGDFDRGGQSTRGPHAGKGPQGFQRSDERIKEMVHEALTDHEHIDATHITVDVKDGEVVLTGTVEDRQTKRLAEDIVDQISGVKDVQNQLRLQR